MLHEIDKLTPIIYELKHYEELAQALEKGDAHIHIDSGRGTMGFGLSEQLKGKVEKAIHSIVAVEVRRLQKQLAQQLRGLNG